MKHSAGECVCGGVSTNSVEAYFSIAKRGLNGTYSSVGKKHFHRYLAEYEFRYNGRKLSDGHRTVAVIQAAEGKRLRYSEPIGRSADNTPTQLTPDRKD